MKAKCLKLTYVEGGYSTVQGIKGGGSPGRSYYKKGKKITQQGFGWAKSVTPSELLLYAKVDDNVLELDVGYYFKREVGRLTKKRRDKIEAAMPEKVELVKNGGFINVSERSLDEWRADAGL